MADDDRARSRGSRVGVLPHPRPAFGGRIGRTAETSRSEPPHIVRAPTGAPNVIVILLDDVGFAQFGTFGGAIPTPALDRLAADGLRYNRYHTTAICSPTRAAMLTGRNHHLSGNGAIPEYATGFPGYDGMWPKSVACLAEIMRQNGYATAALGKWHNTPNWESGPTGPFDRWPTGLGFEQFYGFFGGATNQWEPTLYEGTRPVIRTTPRRDYHLTTELADRAIAWTREVKSVAPDKPFFLWFATGATHAPHQAPKEWIDRFRGQFDEGWDAYREAAFRRQKAMGIIPPDAELTPRPDEIPAWETLNDDQKRLYSRMMEVFAGFTAHTDHEIGRLVQSLRDTEQYDNTLILYSVGDNGASGEGGPEGTVDGMTFFNGVPENVPDMLARIDDLGGPKHYNHFPVGWAWSLDTPFQWIKRVCSHLGGVRNPLVITWPQRIRDAGGLRSQFHHAVDIMPTILEAAGLSMPSEVDGAAQTPLSGVSMAYSFDDPAAPDRRTTQYFEVLGNRAIYHEGWWAGAREALPWIGNSTGPLDLETSRWELYCVERDFSQAVDLAEKQPAKLREMQDLFWIEAGRNGVLPLDRGSNDRMLDAQALSGARAQDRYVFYPGTVGIFEAGAPDIKNRSFSITAHIDATDGSAEGVLVALGGRIGGYSLFVRDRRLRFWYNFLGLEQTCLVAEAEIGRGRTACTVAFDYDGGGRGKGGLLRLFLNGEACGTARLDRTVPRVFARESFDIGMDLNSPVGDYESPYPFTGTLERVEIELR